MYKKGARGLCLICASRNFLIARLYRRENEGLRACSGFLLGRAARVNSITNFEDPLIMGLAALLRGRGGEWRARRRVEWAFRFVSAERAYIGLYVSIWAVGGEFSVLGVIFYAGGKFTNVEDRIFFLPGRSAEREWK